MTRRRFLIVLGALSLAGCQASQESPPQIRYGRDTCAQCGMIISEARFAAAYRTRQGHWRLFDDIGDMLAYQSAHREDVAIFWVHDYETQEWLRAEGVFFVKSPALSTPMGHGVVALGSRARADQLARQVSGDVLTFAELLHAR
jgi:copper chaperone NosL